MTKNIVIARQYLEMDLIEKNASSRQTLPSITSARTSIMCSQILLFSMVSTVYELFQLIEFGNI